MVVGKRWNGPCPHQCEKVGIKLKKKKGNTQNSHTDTHTAAADHSIELFDLSKINDTIKTCSLMICASLQKHSSKKKKKEKREEKRASGQRSRAVAFAFCCRLTFDCLRLHLRPC